MIHLWLQRAWNWLFMILDSWTLRIRLMLYRRGSVSRQRAMWLLSVQVSVSYCWFRTKDTCYWCKGSELFHLSVFILITKNILAGYNMGYFDLVHNDFCKIILAYVLLAIDTRNAAKYYTNDVLITKFRILSTSFAHHFTQLKIKCSWMCQVGMV